MEQDGLVSGSSTTYATFGALLKHLRRRARLTQRELGLAVGYSETQITRLEGDTRRPDPIIVRAQFIEALDLVNEPEWARRLVEMAEAAWHEADTETAVPPAGQPAPRQTNLPSSLTRFIGRGDDMAEVSRLLDGNRLVTLTGAGGAGKTRLSLEVGKAAMRVFPDGVWLVELAPLADGALVPRAVATAFGLQTMNRQALDVLNDYLADRHALLILDNCEHLVQACAELVEALLRACPQMRVLATSREGLNIPGEVTWRVPPLATDEAVQLFAERASAARPDFMVTAANRMQVERLCRRLDDMPLAIELAAARVRAFTVEQLAARMDDIFRLLTGGSRTALPRQQTLRATIDWSYNLLSEQEQILLRRLAVFAGGWTAEAAEQVCAGPYGCDILVLLLDLVNKSLVVAETDEAAGKVRYRLQETIHQYASEALRLAGGDTGEQSRVRQRHLEYFTELAERGALRAPDGYRSWIWDVTVAAEFDNTRAALSWAAESGAWQTGWRLIEGIHGVWAVLGYGEELCEWMRAVVLANPAASEASHVHALLAMASLAHTRGDIVEGFERYREASAHAHQLADEGLILEADLWLGADTPDDEAAIALLNDVIRGTRQAGSNGLESDALSLLGDRLRLRGDLRGAMAPLTESVRLARDSGNRGALAGQLTLLARLLIDLGEYAQARAVLDESITISRQERLQGTLEDGLLDLARVGLHQADAELVRETLNECIPYFHRIDDLESVARGLVLAAGLAHTLAESVRAASLLAAAAVIRRDHHTHGIYERDHFAEYDRHLPAVRTALAPSDFARAWAGGEHMTLAQAVAYALQGSEMDEPLAE